MSSLYHGVSHFLKRFKPMCYQSLSLVSHSFLWELITCVCSELGVTSSLHRLALTFSKRERFLFSLIIQNKRAVVSRSGLALLPFCVCIDRAKERQTEVVSRDECVLESRITVSFVNSVLPFVCAFKKEETIRTPVHQHTVPHTHIHTHGAHSCWADTAG